MAKKPVKGTPAGKTKPGLKSPAKAPKTGKPSKASGSKDAPKKNALVQAISRVAKAVASRAKPKTVAAKTAVPKTVTQKTAKLVAKPAPKAVSKPAAAPKTVAPSPLVKSQPPAKAAPAPKPVPVAAPKPPIAKPQQSIGAVPSHTPTRPVNESPPVDHNAALVPLYLGATHGYLSRPIDDTWSEAIGRYRAALQSAIDYEVKRAPDSRIAMANFVHQKITALMTQLTARLQTVLRDKQAATNEELVQALHQQAKRLTGEIKVLLEVLQSAVSQKGLMKGLPSTPASISTSLLSWVARVADFERAL